MKRAKDPELPSQVREFLRSYLSRIPPYLLGIHPAPRQKLEFLPLATFVAKKVESMMQSGTCKDSKR
jgi:hypothetical protein